MAANEANQHHTGGIVHPDDQPVLIAGDIEHHSVICEETGGTKLCLDVGRRCPIGLLRFLVPRPERSFGLAMVGLLPKLPQRFSTDDSHA